MVSSGRRAHEGETRTVIDGTVVHGVLVDTETRCVHYDTTRDVVAIRFHCCGSYYACHACHDTLTTHDATQWPREAYDTRAVLCGRCGSTQSIRGYLDNDDGCPACGGDFNPGCREHSQYYFHE